MMKLKLERMLQQILKSDEQKSEEMQQNKFLKHPHQIIKRRCRGQVNGQ